MDNDFFQKIVHNIDSPLYITDPEGILVYVNPAFEEVTGYTQDEVLGTKSSVLKSGKMPESYYKRLWGRLLSGETWKEEIINKRKDGTNYVVLQYITPIAGDRGDIEYYAAVQYDITREKELQDEREIFFDVSVDLFCIVDSDGRIKQVNNAWGEILGQHSEDLYQRPLIELIHPDDHDRFSEVQTRLMDTETIAKLDTRVRTVGEAYNWVSWRAYFNKDRQLFYASGRDIQEQVEMEQKIRRISVTDALTGAGNRLRFDEEIEKEFSRFGRYGETFALIMFDIDHFKKINDTYGHHSGDKVLQQLVERTQGQLRSTDMLFRWGGEEFFILCPHTDVDDAKNLAERIRRSVEAEVFDDVGKVTISAAFGLAYEGDTEETLLLRIDAALYEAKGRGRNRIEAAEGPGTR